MNNSRVKHLSGVFETADSPGAVQKRASSPASSTPSQGGAAGSVDTERMCKERNSMVIDKFLRQEVIPRGGMPGASHPSAIGKAPPNENDNKAKVIPKFSGSAHPVYGLMLNGKSHETSTTKKKIVIPPSSAY
eukprot:gene199-240_t